MMDCRFSRAGDHFELAIERRFAHPPEKVWRVLTERELLRQWFPCDVIGDWSVGETLQFVFLNEHGDGLSEEDLRGEVLVVEPHERLEFTWGKYRYRCELSPDGDGCLLRFTETLGDASEGARSAAGWEMCFENIDALIQGVEVAAFVYQVWQKKFNKYVERFEPEMGPQQGAPGMPETDKGDG